MKLIFACLIFFLCVLLPIIPETNGDIAVGLKTNDEKLLVVSKRNQETKRVLENQQIETTTNQHPGKGWEKRKPSKRPNNRFNQLNMKGKSNNGRKRRPINEKKGLAKKSSGRVPTIQYLKRTPHTDHLNKALDEMLIILSQTLTSQNSSFSIKLHNFYEDMEISPWSIVQFNKTNTTEPEKKRSTRASNILEEDYTPKIDEKDDLNLEEEQKLSPAFPDKRDEDEIIGNFTELANLEDSFMNTTIREDDDEDNIMGIKEINGTRPLHGKQFYLVPKPSPVAFLDGTVEYNFQLLSKTRKLTLLEEHSPTLHKDNHRMPKKMGVKQKRSRRRGSSRRPNAIVEGLALIQRSGDVMVGIRGENLTTRLIDIPLEIGPLQFVMDQRAGFPLQFSRVLSPPLVAHLRLTEFGGKLVTAQLKPKKIQPNDPLVTLRLREDGRIPTQMETARLVSYLSQEMTNNWNSGYLIRRVQRLFKQLYMGETRSKRIDFNFDDVWKFVQILGVSKFGQQAPNDASSSASLITDNNNVKALPVS